MDLRLIHILAGLLALASGAVALYAAKGSPLHRKSGSLFVISMLTMTLSGLEMSIFFHLNRLNIIAASLTLYLVCSGWLTVKRSLADSRAAVRGLMLLALTISSAAFAWGAMALNRPLGRIDGMSPEPLFVFGTVALIGGLLDLRLLRAGGIQGPHRLARHLWRMGLAMLIATLSFFLGQAKLFPQAVRETGLLSLPILLVLLVLLVSLGRLFFARRRGAATRLPRGWQTRDAG